MRRFEILVLIGVMLSCMMPLTVRGAVTEPSTLVTDKGVYTAGDKVTVTYELTNTSAESLNLTFTSSQRFDFTIMGNGLFYRWATGKSFMDVMGAESIEPGGKLTYVSNWTIPAGIKDGTYTISFTLTQKQSAFGASTTFQVASAGIPAKPAFPDIATSFARSSIERLFARKLVAGYRNGLFQPQSVVTRAESAVMVSRARGFQSYAGLDGKWTDVASDYWAYSSITALDRATDGAALTWIAGDHFDPSQPVTRAQFIVALLAPADQIGSQTSPFTDVPAGSFGAQAIALAYSRGIVAGNGQGDSITFNPDRLITRAEATVILDRFLTFSEQSGG